MRQTSLTHAHWHTLYLSWQLLDSVGVERIHDWLDGCEGRGAYCFLGMSTHESIDGLAFAFEYEEDAIDFVTRWCHAPAH